MGARVGGQTECLCLCKVQSGASRSRGHGGYKQNGGWESGSSAGWMGIDVDVDKTALGETRTRARRHACGGQRVRLPFCQTLTQTYERN